VPRLVTVAVLAAGLLAAAAPAANACDLDHCAGTSVVCGYVDCTPPPYLGCYQPLGLVRICL
jgi:hypothetical protein